MTEQEEKVKIVNKNDEQITTSLQEFVNKHVKLISREAIIKSIENFYCIKNGAGGLHIKKSITEKLNKMFFEK